VHIKQTQIKKKITLDVSSAAMFIGLSAVFSAWITPLLPRVPIWGIAIIDPISIIWITCYYIFGWRSGLICLVGGTLILFLFDPTGIGPIFKFLATLPFILIPTIYWWLESRYKGPKLRFQKWIAVPTNNIKSNVIALGARLVLMIMSNYIFFMTALGGDISWLSLSFLGLPQVTGWSAVILFVIIINTWQSFWDTFIPYNLSFNLVARYLKI